MIIYLGSDNRGHYLKENIFAYLSKHNYKVREINGTDQDGSDEYPYISHMVALKIIGSDLSDARGILVCGSGQGMAMTANRTAGVRAAIVWDAYEAKISRDETNSNILCLPAREFEDNPEAWQGIIETWLSTSFSKAPRFKRQIAQMDDI